MQKIRVLSVFGTRPEVIKFIPVLLELEKRPEIESIICVTGQHREMLDQMMGIAHLTADIDLDVMEPNQSLNQLTSKVLLAMPDIFEQTKPDRILVQGDTTTGFATTLAAFYAGIPVGHIEAGLRSGDLFAPWPEEFNRRTISIAADIHFAPTESAKASLLAEGVGAENVHMTGNTVIDALHFYVNALKNDDTKMNELHEKFSFLDESKKLILVTAHRRENFDGGIESMCDAFSHITRDHPDAEIIFPVHLNPNVKHVVDERLSQTERVHLLPPQDYFSFLYLMDRCYFIISDSGGVQEEAPSLMKPVLVTRDTTERPEGLEANVTKLVGTDTGIIMSEARKLLTDETYYQAMQQGADLYGDGNSAKRIAYAIIAKHNEQERLKHAV